MSKEDVQIAYTGVDIVREVIENNSRYSRDNVRFLVCDAIQTPLPRADMALCREILFHLSFNDAMKDSWGYGEAISSPRNERALRRMRARWKRPGLSVPSEGHRSMKTIAIWSSDYVQLTGQALVTARVVRHQPDIRWREYIYKGPALSSLCTWLRASLRLWLDIACGRVRTLYLVCSRSNGGFLRDIPALLTSLVGLRVVVHAHGSDIVDLLSARALSPFARRLYDRCEIIVPSTHLVHPVEELTGHTPFLCENYYASETPPLETNGNDNTLVVLWNSNVMASKGFFDLAAAVGRLCKEGLPVRLISVGRPMGDREMTAREATDCLDRLLVEGWFDYRGKVDQITAINLTAETDVIALPSRSESQGIAVIEGMCAGKAILVSDIPALRATLRDYPAHFVSVCSVDAIEETLRDMLRAKQAGPMVFASSRQKAAAAARQRFSMERFDREMAAILHGGDSER